ncbi:MAG: alanine racemase [Thermoanaerobaculum sp.]|nr:alanine racemase [Thermoanaerobaculum sp.]
MQQGHPTTWCEISGAHLAHNLQLFRRLLRPGTGVAAVVKANAYGHGVAQVVPVLEQLGVEMYAVHSLAEAQEVRACGGQKPILIMGYLTPGQLAAMEDPTMHVLLSSPEVLQGLAARGRELGVAWPVHVKVDTGTHRQGVPPEEAAELARVAQRSGLAVVGLATHFANIEDTTDHSYAFLQLQRFHHALRLVERVTGPLPLVHAACSAAALLFRETDFTMARLGISLYGHWPSRETYLSWLLAHGRNGIQLKPVLAWKALVGQVKAVGARDPIGYGLSSRPTRPTRLAVLPVGYAEGYPRALSNRASVLVRGSRAPVLGRVCMNITMVDVTDIPEVGEGDLATLLGQDGEERLTAEELAELAGTINYEILARLSPSLPRRLVHWPPPETT